MRVWIIASLAGTLLALSAPALAAPPSEQCPQPRFTGRAPDPDYGYSNPLSASKENLSAAKKMYLGKDGHFGCENCHGKKGEGNGPLASQYDPRPRNFACPQTVRAIPDGQLFWIIRNGSPDTGMPPHPEYSEVEMWRLVLYIRLLADQK
ncbi:MAG: c-type cytochrome [Moraxellaceae bacterium]